MSMDNVQDIYPLTPLQEGMLYHLVRDRDAGVYVQQFQTRFGPGFDEELFRRAWDAVVARHAALRTLFVWDGMDDPLQVVRDRVQLDWERADWRNGAHGGADAALDEWLAADRRRGFALDSAPLMRFLLAALPDGRTGFVWSFPHILLDGWSAGIVMADVYAACAALHRGEALPGGDAPPFRDYVAWLRDRDDAATAAFWKGQLADLGEPTTLSPIYRPDGDTAFGRVLLSLSPEATTRLKRRAAAERLTLSTVVHGAWARLLASCSGQDDVVFGSTVAGRPADLPGVDRMAGLFINTVPARATLRWEMAVADWLRGLQNDLLDGQDHAHLGLADMQALSGVPAGDPLFDSMVVFENAPELPPPADLPFAIEASDTRERSHYALTLFAGVGEQLDIALAWSGTHLHRDIVERLADALGAILRDWGHGMDHPLADTPLMDGRTRSALIPRQNGPQRSLPAPSTLHDWIAEQARACPDAMAVSDGERDLSYRELADLASRMAGLLREAGCEPGDRVGVYMDRRTAILPVFLGILRCGAAYVPLDPAYPSARLAAMVADAGIRIVVCDNALREAVPGSDVTRIAIDPDMSVMKAAAPIAPVTSGSDPLAYVIYTSGSTGIPKGVEIHHRAILNTLLAMAEHPGFAPGDRLLALAPFSFDMSVPDLFLPLITGGRLVIADRSSAMDGEALLRRIREADITVLQATPTTWRMLVDAGWQDRLPVRMICGGEPLPADLAVELLKRGGELWNFYGPTEAAVWCATQRIESPDAPVRIGGPIANTLFSVRDRTGQPLPPGIPGELWIGGAGLAAGYRNRPELTAERFVTEPGESGMAIRWYRSGDLVRHHDDGTMDFLGRIDHQVKIRGHRIELGEIEAALTSHPSVASAVVTAVGAAGEAELAAYLVCGDGERPDTTDLRHHLAAVLPEYMIPSHIVFLQAFPLTPSGKIDRKALPAPEAGNRASLPIVPPRSDTERTIAAIWEAILGRDGFGVDDDFFELGGHSLKAMRVLSRLRDAVDAPLTMRDIFDAPTIAGLAERIDGAGAQLPDLPDIPRQPRDSALPLAFTQRRLWFLEQLLGDGTVYLIPAAVRLRGELDVAALQRGLDLLLARHEALRTRIVADDRPGQVFEPAGPFPLAREDRSDTAPAEREAVASELAEAEARRSFDGEGLLVRANLVRFADDDHLFLLTLHHLIADGWSIDLLFRELSRSYAAFTSGAIPELPDLPLQFADVAAWQQAPEREAALANGLAFWATELVGDHPLELPTDLHRPAVETHRGVRVHADLPAPLTQALRKLAAAHGATLFQVLLSAFQALLARYSGQDDIRVGTPIAGRVHPASEGLVGFFSNTIVIRGDHSGAPDFPTLLGRIRERCLHAFAHQDVPFEMLVERLRPERDLSRNPLFQAFFLLQEDPWRTVELPGVTLSPVEIDPGTAKFDLTLSIDEHPERLHLTLEVNRDLFEAATAERMTAHFRTLLEAITRDPAGPVAAIPLLPPEEEHRLLVEWNDTAMALPERQVLTDFISETAAASPEKVAVRVGDASLSYGDLDARANRFAHYLRAAGYGPGSHIGVALPRTPEMPVALLGILKAGAAYVPLDPRFPRERLAFMLADAGVELLVSHSAVAAQFADFSGRVLPIDVEWAAIAEQPDTAPEHAVTPADLAYIIYTSGSTGTPKGVRISHRALLNFLISMRREPGMSGEDVLLAVTTLSFDIAGLELYLPLLCGATVVLADSDTAADGRALLDLVHTSGATIMQATPATWRLLLQSGWTERLALTALCGGEPLPHDLAAGLLERCTALWNLYGPTETTIWSTVERITDPEVITVGRPIANTQVYILDDARRPVPTGVVGELCIGGAGLADGYHNRPELTADRFVTAPFAAPATPGGRLYRTGDLARWRNDGRLEHLGRADQQLKVRGFRVEPGEIEETLRRHDAVERAAVVARDFGPGDRRLIAYLVINGPETVRVSDIRRFLKQYLPDYMIPATVVFLDALPLTPNGKVDRKALPAPEGGDGGADHVPPATEMETRLAAIWQEVLQVERVGANDNFFDLGGHSLLAMTVIAEIHKATGARLTPRDILLRTLAQLAAQCERGAADPSGESGGERRTLFEKLRGTILRS